jgi:uncharacterized metal-binding protein
MTHCGESIDGATQALLENQELRELARQSSIQEAECYDRRHERPFVKRPVKPRVQETWELAHKMGWTRIGLAFCGGLAEEARAVANLFEAQGLEVVSVCCKLGAVPKEELGLDDEDKIRAGGHESMCHPLAQAEVLNQARTQLNVMLGLCVGHDALFLRHSEAFCTVLAAKDRVTAHNPLAAVYTAGSYFDRLKQPR